MRSGRRRLVPLVALSFVAGVLLTAGPASIGPGTFGPAEVAAAKPPEPTPTPTPSPTPVPSPTPTPTPTPTPEPTPTPVDPAAKLRGDLAALVSGAATLDPRIPGLLPDNVPGELPYFALLTEPFAGTHGAALADLGVRVLRTYRTIDLVAVASDAAAVTAVAELPWVSSLAPVELVFALAEEREVDQTKGTTADVGAPAWWDRGVTGTGVRIAVLDTGIDQIHPDLDDLDFRAWSGLLHDAKVVEARDFNGGDCRLGAGDGHGHGTHVAGIAAGTGEGTALADDDGKYAGIAPGAELASGKVLTDAGAGVNSDLLAAMEWAAMPAEGILGCAVGADIVNMSLGSEARPDRLNSGSDIDLVSLMLNRLTVRYGTLFVVALGNSGPYIGSALEAAGSAAQALSVSATAKDYDVNHDDTLAGDACAGWRHPGGGNTCAAGVGDQPSSISSFSSRGPSGDVWLRPDIAAPGYDIVSAQASTGTQLAGNDQVAGTRLDPLYATASGTSMAAPAAAGSAALVLDAYRQRYGANPAGASGLPGAGAGAATLLRAALMNGAVGDLFESRWILSIFPGGLPTCPPDLEPSSFGICDFIEALGAVVGSTTVYEVRNGPSDPYVGPLAEGAGKVRIGNAIAALRDGIVVYSTASGSGETAGTGPRDLQGSWQVGAVAAGTTVEQRFVIHSAPGAAQAKVTFSFVPGQPSDGSQAIPTSGGSAWTVSVPKTTMVKPGKDAIVTMKLKVPASAPAGMRSGIVLVNVAGVNGADGVAGRGQVLRIPVFAAVTLHDPDIASGNLPGPSAAIDTARDVFAKSDTFWPSAVGQPGTGSNADWLVQPVDLAAGLTEAVFTAWDTARLGNTYDLYLYDTRLDLIASTHPFAAEGVTDSQANAARGPSTAADPARLVLTAPAGGRYYLAISRAKVGRDYLTAAGDMGSAAIRLDEIR
jgi:subtilisin family serine protease